MGRLERARERVHDVIFNHDTTAGRAFDVALIAAILASVAVVMLDTVAPVALRYRGMLRAAEWFFTALFTVEYALRLATAHHRRRYATSFYGIIDLIAVLPTYVAVVLPEGRLFIIVRVFRVLRVFRILKLSEYLVESNLLARAVRASRRKIVVFIFAVLTIVVVVGALMYLVEGPAAGFTSIPRSMYWAIVTLTTVGYGDIAPQTPLGQAIAAAVMILGYGIIAVPTGIVTVELQRAAREAEPATPATPAAAEARRCARCGRAGHDSDARYCKSCGERLGGASRGAAASGLG